MGMVIHSPDGRSSQVIVPVGVPPGGVFGVPIPPTELQLAYERELENQAKEEEDTKPRASSSGGYEVSNTRYQSMTRRSTRSPNTRASMMTDPTEAGDPDSDSHTSVCGPVCLRSSRAIRTSADKIK